MPFTPSHAVVALPFVRTPLVPAAVAVGAMAPDLPLFVRASPLGYGRTHDPAWIAATVLLALGLLLVWRCVLRPAVRELAPAPLGDRLPAEWDAGAAAALRSTFTQSHGGGRGERSARRSPVLPVLLLLASLAVGVASHIAWDLFTHEGRWGTTAFPALEAGWGPLPGYKWLQHGSSVVGLVILAVWGGLWLARRPVAASVPRILPPIVRWIWWLSLPTVLAVAWLSGLAAMGPFDEAFTPQHLAYRVLPPACAVWGMLTIALAVTVQVMRGLRSRAVA
jgi:hypothetical protein